MIYLDSLYFAQSLLIRVLLPFIVVLSIAVFAYIFKQVTISGAIGAFILGYITIYLGGFSSFLIFMFFFISAACISKATKNLNNDLSKMHKKGSRRDIMQVIANGAPAVLALILYTFTSNHIFIVVFASCVAESCSDTWAGDIGILSKTNPVSIINFKPVKKGLSGGVSLLGTSTSLLASVLIAMMYFTSYIDTSLALALVVAAASFAGALADSFLGATIQVHYYNEEKGLITEKKYNEKGKELDKIRGIRFFDNDMVNLTSNLISFLLAFSLASLII